jgi:hypothetical protein
VKVCFNVLIPTYVKNVCFNICAFVGITYLKNKKMFQTAVSPRRKVDIHDTNKFLYYVPSSRRVLASRKLRVAPYPYKPKLNVRQHLAEISLDICLVSMTKTEDNKHSFPIWIGSVHSSSTLSRVSNISCMHRNESNQ